MDERAFFRESRANKSASLHVRFAGRQNPMTCSGLYGKKVDRLPGNADERDRAKFKKAESYMVLVTDKVPCKNMRCRRMFDVSGIKTTAYIVDDARSQ